MSTTKELLEFIGTLSALTVEERESDMLAEIVEIIKRDGKDKPDGGEAHNG